MTRVEGRPNVEVRDANAACASCHREIYERYRTTPMGNASGVAADGFIPADFTHDASGVHYKVTEEGRTIWLNYEREHPAPDRELNGKQELRYFIGSGKRGRTYLFEQHGYWFEAPINWYGKKQLWDMAPNFQDARSMPLTLPVDPGCLHCHASDVARSLPEARNLYSGEPFAHGGITCAACHGDGTVHVSSAGKVHMMNIDLLPPVRRDSICLNCHLEGQSVVIRFGRKSEDFVPGDDLFHFAEYFIYKAENGAGGRATSQWEALLRSECKKKSGDRMTCTTCHDPHGSPSADVKVEFYRKQCLECHEKARFGERHHPENRDCATCHMARPASNDIAHEQITDHWIRKRVSNKREPAATTGELEPIEGTGADERDLGLAYVQMTLGGNQDAGSRALTLLRRTENAEGVARKDYELHADLGFLEQLAGEMDLAKTEYQRALEADPFDATAAGDLAVIAAQKHEYSEAEHLWQGVFDRDPGQVVAGMDLAIVECGTGRANAATATLERILEFSPDETKTRDMLLAIRSGRQRCGSR